ncbi:PEP-CTERM sorting domain-containing protein [Aeoliella sp. SH292]|uniref:PEP-CTERM sorting domain-containing protein n=1 Tax=Aeoliella sp. SH292 TaxID=3454464 RepID=UPI003F9D075E
MRKRLMEWRRKVLCLLAAVCAGCLILSTAQAHEPLPVASVELDATPALAELAAQAETQPLEKTTTPAVTIAEPGSIGLLVLAGLMGGAIAMRRRLG